ncbi:hypothetical protein FRB95_000600 [Tulasnella sp. JGI-2019a]|nr:hypothetical protein FRB95_000600 [Tulasnella sp. JGI-2019a]
MLSALLSTNIVMMSAVIEISASVNGILATLLVLQLNLYQERTLKRDAEGAPLMTGATFKFAGLGTPSVKPGEWSPTQSLVITRRRASMSIVEGQHSNSGEDIAHQQASAHFA